MPPKLRGLTHCRKWQQVPFVRRSAHKAKSIRRLGALASKPAGTSRLDLGQGEVGVAARNQRATTTAPVHRQAFTSLFTQWLLRLSLSVRALAASRRWIAGSTRSPNLPLKAFLPDGAFPCPPRGSLQSFLPLLHRKRVKPEISRCGPLIVIAVNWINLGAEAAIFRLSRFRNQFTHAA